MENKLEDQVIYPKDLLFAALYRWKAAIVVGLVLAILLGGFQLRNMGQNVTDENGSNAHHAAMAEYEAKRDALQKQLDILENERNAEEAHLRQSVYLNLDPYNHYRGTLQMYVYTNYQIQPDKTYQTPDIAQHLLSGYFSLMYSDEAIQTMADSMGLTWRQMSELYTVTYDAERNTLTATVSGADQETVQQLLDQVKNLMRNAETTLNETIGVHELRPVYSSVNLVVDTDIHSINRDTWDYLNYLKEQIAKVKDEQAGLQVPVTTTVSSVSAAVFALLGFVAGVAIVAVCAWFGHMESDKIYSSRLLSLRTGIKVLGTMTVTKFNFIDKTFRKWEGRDADDPKDKASLLACDLHNRFPTGKLLITGSGKTEDRAPLLNALKEAGVDAEDAGDILKDTQAVATLQKADAVVLVAPCGNATYQDVFRQAQTVEDYEKPLLGCVVLNG